MRILKIMRLFHRVGFAEGLRRIALFGWSLLVYRFDLILLVKRPLVVAPEPANPGCELRGMGLDEIDRLDAALYLDRPEMLRRFGRGDACAVVIADDQIAASAWGSTAVAHIPEVFMMAPLPPRTGYVFTVECDRAFRRRGFGSAVVREIERLAHASGVETMTVAVHPANTPSLTLFKRMGYRPFKTVSARRILGMKSVRSEVIDAAYAHLLPSPAERRPDDR